MKKIVLICLFLNTYLLSAQNQPKKISFSANNISKIDIIKLIENNSDYTFYYIKDWIDNKQMTLSFNNSDIKDILNVIFDNSTINYFILNNKIILSKGDLIQRSLYYNDQPQSKTPFFFNRKQKGNIVKIGKEIKEIKEKHSLSGFIRNKKTNKPLKGVTVYERNNNIYTTTDINGYYNINLPYGKNRLEAYLVNFSSNYTDIIIYNNGILDIFLAEESEQLDEVVIDANRNKNIRQTVAGITQIKSEEIKNIPLVLGERDILKVATTLPGINSAGEGSDGINVRGGKVDQNLFLLENGTLYNPNHFLGLFSAINPFATNDLKIYKGSIPAEHGGRLSSVFDISLKTPNNTKFKGEASIGPVTGNINIEAPVIKGKSGIMIGFRSTYSDWILNLIDNKDLKTSNVSFYDAVIKYNYKLNDNNDINLTNYYSKDKYQIASDTINSYSNIVNSLNWQHRFNNKNSLILTLANSNYSFNINYKKNDNNKGFNLKYLINDTNLKFKFKYIYSNIHNIDYGIDLKLYNISPGKIKPQGSSSNVTALSIPIEKGLENSLFISDELILNKKITFNLAMRLSQYIALGSSEVRTYQKNTPKNSSTLIKTKKYKNNEIFKTYEGLSYRLSARYSLTKDLSLKASFNKSFQYIHRLNNNTSATPVDTWRLSDSNIKPQEGIQTSFGIFKNINGNNYEFSIEGYYKKYKNLLDYKVGATLLLNENIETDVLQGNGKSYGVEFLVKKNKGKLNGWLGYSYSKSLIQLNSKFDEEKVNNGNFFPTNYDKPHDFSLVLNYKLTKRYSFSTNFTYQTGRPITYPSGKYIYNDVEFLTYTNRNQFRIPDYYRLDIGLNIEGNHKVKKIAHSFWSVSVYNVLGRNNPYSVYFENINGNVNGYKSSIFSTPIPTITYNFKF